MTAPHTLSNAANLPATLALTDAAALLGIGRTHAYALVAAGTFPVPVLRLGHALRVPTAPLLALLGLPLPGAPDTANPHTTPAPTPDAGGANEDTPAHDEEPS